MSDWLITKVARGTRRAVFLDRDGVINRMWLHPEFGTVDSPASPEQFELLPGAGEAIAELKRLGLLVIVVSNQPGIAKGKFTPALLAAIEHKMVAAIEAAGGHLDAVYNCLHHPDAVLDEYRLTCDCRKPRPGLLVRAAREWDIDLSRSYLIGDGVTDIAAGCAITATASPRITPGRITSSVIYKNRPWRFAALRWAKRIGFDNSP